MRGRCVSASARPPNCVPKPTAGVLVGQNWSASAGCGLARRWASMRIWLLIVCFTLAPAALACTFTPPPEFKEVVRAADTIAVVRVGDQRITDEVLERRPVIEGDLEVVESIRGPWPEFKRVRFINDYCGGVRLDVGHHYVIFTQQIGPVLRLMPADPSIIWIDSEYIPGFDTQNYKYPFLKSVRAFVQGDNGVEGIDPFPNIERTGIARRVDCRFCSPGADRPMPN